MNSQDVGTNALPSAGLAPLTTNQDTETVNFVPPNDSKKKVVARGVDISTNTAEDLTSRVDSSMSGMEVPSAGESSPLPITLLGVSSSRSAESNITTDGPPAGQSITDLSSGDGNPPKVMINEMALPRPMFGAAPTATRAMSPSEAAKEPFTLSSDRGLPQLRSTNSSSSGDSRHQQNTSDPHNPSTALTMSNPPPLLTEHNPSFTCDSTGEE